MAELEALGLAEVVAVDLVRERAVARRRSADSRSVRTSTYGSSAQPVAAAERRGGDRAGSGRSPSSGSSRSTRPRSSVASGRDVERSVAEERVRVRVEAQREVAVVDRVPSRRVHARSAAGRFGRSGGTRWRTPRRRTADGRRSASARAALDLGDHRGVVAHADVEQEVPAVDPAEPDPADRVCGRARRAGHRSPRSGRWAGRSCGRTRSSSRRAARPAPSSVPARPLAASLSVPSPPSTTTTSVPSAAAPCASRVAWPRRFVSARRDVVVGRQRLLDHDTRRGR